MSGLVVFSRDPGATQRLVALADALTSTPGAQEAEGLTRLRFEAAALRTNVRVFARPPGETMWIEAGYRPERWSGSDDASAERLLRDAAAGLLLTGTSDVDEPGDRALWRAARRIGISSHVVLDQRVNLALRFADPDGTVTYPDWIYVRDDGDAQALRAAGVEVPTRMIGDLHLQRLRSKAVVIADEDRSALRREWGVPADRLVLLFVSECGREMTAAGRAMLYDEVAELDRLIAALEDGRFEGIEDARPQNVSLVIRPHPRDREDKYASYAGRRDSGLHVAVSAKGSSELAIQAADLVVGMNSSMLHDAFGIGRPVYSVTGHKLGDVPGAMR